MRDADIRHVLLRELRSRYDDEQTTIVEELCVCRREARVDVAVVNGRLEGYEIKSARDSLARLQGQSELYNRVFDRLTIVAAQKHLGGAERTLPRWWGLATVVPVDGALALDLLRRPGPNPGVEPEAVAQLLWRDEVLKLLEANGGTEGLRSKPRRILWADLAERMPPDALADGVRRAIRARGDWRSADRRP